MGIEVFVARVPEDEADWMSARLTPAERERADRFLRGEDRRAYLAAHALLRFALDYCTGASQSWTFANGAFGKPRLAGPVRGPFFNLSHCTTWVSVAVSSAAEVGVDVECEDRMEVLADLDHVWLSEAERVVLNALPPAAQDRQRLSWWVAKEALVKALGMGLQVPLDELALPLTPSGVFSALRLPLAFGPDAAGWAARVYGGSGFLLGLATAAPARADLDVPGWHEVAMESACPRFKTSV